MERARPTQHGHLVTLETAKALVLTEIEREDGQMITRVAEEAFNRVIQREHEAVSNYQATAANTEEPQDNGA